MRVMKFKAKNFRGFIDTGDITQDPINLLVGKNSIGKSSYARLFPLFWQGIGIKKRSPLIWNGTLVDYGEFNDVLSIYKNSEYIEFQFSIINPPSLAKAKSKSKSNLIKQSAINILNFGKIVVDIRIGYDTNHKVTYLASLDVSITNGCKFKYTFNPQNEISSISYNGSEIISPSDFEGYTLESRPNFIIPMHEYFMKDNEDVLYRAHPATRMALFNFLKNKLHGRFGNEKIHDICNTLNVIGTPDRVTTYYEKLPLDFSSWHNFKLLAQEDDEIKQDFIKLINISSSLGLLRDIDHCLELFFSNVTYINPLRASAERYYRKQDLSIDNIDSRGANLPFFLNSLPINELKNLNEWLNKNLDIEVLIMSTDGHVMINLKDNATGRINNIADMGFGFSQVLPLAVQAWISKNSKSKSANQSKQILVWEQPELHLHPAMQRRLANLIANTVKDNNISFYIETHSTSIINELGSLILDGDLEEDDIRVLLFQQEDEGHTSVTKTAFDNEGTLQNFPLGFLS
ncbi:AAA family ATPase [Aeromonas caviae]|uniref:AAA family ATPase n=1 Tax=Aeromonas caviae TaxID=648 RepID=UPI0021C98520|nr:AAA family ATPase [Aeromonas caviae]MCR9026343.1 AAA family ATPase [Aeromonas caviae]